MEPVQTAFFGYWLAGDRLGVVGWTGAALIMLAIVVSEPAAAEALRRFAAALMDAVVLALGSAALFGAMTVALRLALLRNADARS